MINQQYKIVKKLGEGRSNVLLCRDIHLGDQEIAVKVLSASSGEEEKKYFKNEFITLRNINHPNIIKSYDYGIAWEITDPSYTAMEGSFFFALEYFDGVELPDFPGIYNENTLKEVIKQVCEALFYLHQSGYIHYDLKPENILISGNNDKIKIKLVDLGFTARNHRQNQIQGTAQYIAPELLRGEPHNHSVDLYSLGIIIYQFIYKRFPFRADTQLEIYKAQLEQEFEYPESGYSEELTLILKKLLSKDIRQRYTSALQVIRDLGFEIDTEVTSHFIPVKCFAARKDIISILKKYIQDKSSTEIFIIKGSEGAGKTALFEKLSQVLESPVLVENANRQTGFEFIKKLLKKISYSEFIYPSLTQAEKDKLLKLIQGDSTSPGTDIRSYISSVCHRNNFTLLLDDFESFDGYSLGILKDILPILQSNHVKVILAENSESKTSSDSFYNRREIHLSSFMENELTDFLEMSYSSFFPVADLKKAILLYADLLPGSIDSFIKDLLFLNIIKYTGEGVTFQFTQDNEKLLRSSHEEIYQARLNQLSTQELKAAQLISCFKYSPDLQILSLLIEEDTESCEKIFHNLQTKNILSDENKGNALLFSSGGIQDYIYANIADKQQKHLFIAKLLETRFPEFSRVETARQYELAGAFEESYLIIKKEIEEGGEKLSLQYKKNLLENTLNFPLKKEFENEIRISLAATLFSLSDYKASYDLIKDYVKENGDGKNYEASFITGASMVGIGEFTGGIQYLRNLMHQVPEKRKPELLLSIASAEFDADNFNEAERICSSILDNPNAGIEETGKSLNLLGLIKIYTQNDFDEALVFFSRAEEVYSSGDHLFGVAQMQNNIANIFNMRGDFDRAETYWNKSLKINLEIGNLEQEATLLLNFGVHYFEKQDYDQAIYYYKRALSIYSSLGNRLREGIVEVNLGEIYLVICEYQEALNYLLSSTSSLHSLKSYNEESEAIYMLAKLYSVIGDSGNFEKTVVRYSDLNKTENLLDKNEIYLRFLQIIKTIKFSSEKPDLTEMQILRNYFLEQKEKLKFLECSFYIIAAFIKENKFQEAEKELKSESLIENCRNMIAEAERNYWLSVLTKTLPELNLEPEIEYLQRAYDIVNDRNILEITWKILFALAINCHARGIYTKAEEYVFYCSSLIYFISEKIKNANLKKTYLEEPERKAAAEILKKLEEHY